MSNFNQRIANLSPEKRELFELKLKEKKDNLQDAQTITRRKGIEQLPLSFAQQRLWFLEQFEPGIPLYNIARAFQIKGSLNVEALWLAVNALVDRHESLRTTFSKVDGNPVQVIAPALPEEADRDKAWSLSVEDLQEYPETEGRDKALLLAREEAQLPFDLVHGPLFRAKLLQLGNEDYICLLTIHHIISDGWSMGVFNRELGTLYSTFCSGKQSPLSELSVQYADFALWQRNWLQGEILEKQISYWKRQLDGTPPLLELPTDYPRPAVQTFHGAKQYFSLPKELSTSINELSSREGVTSFMFMLAAFQVLLHRYTGQTDIVVGSPIANRTRGEIEHLIGFFANTLVLRGDLSGNPTFHDFLQRIREVAIGAYTHQDLPFEKLVEELQPERNLSHSPLFQVLFAYNNAPLVDLELGDLSLSPLKVDSKIAKFDLSFYLTGSDKEIKGFAEYNTDLFNSATICRMLNHFETLLSGIVADPKQRINHLPLLTEPEKQQLLFEWNDTNKDYPQNTCLHQLFEKQAEKSPNKIALVFNDSSVTYEDLNYRANQFAHYLKSIGASPEALVGVCFERSIEMVVAVLGVLKAGCAYIPLDPEYPMERLSFMLSDSQAPMLVTQKHLISYLPDNKPRTVFIDDDWGKISQESKENLENTNIEPCNLAYIIYTSGSTGKPKGVAIEHRSAVAMIIWAHSVFSKDEVSGVLAATSICFDLSVFEMFLPLTLGGKVILAKDVLALPSLPAVSAVTLINTVPSAITELIRLGGLSHSVTTVNLAGEPLKPSLVNKIYSCSKVKRVYDLYGPSEDTTYSTWTLRTVDGPYTIGRPIANTQAYILDHYKQPVPVGIPGELYLGGDGLARGYLNRPELTSDKFISNPFGKDQNARLYKTGDLARYLPDGKIVFLGRMDHQVKIRGFRIELGEIESVLSQHDVIKECAAITYEDKQGNWNIGAFFVSDSSFSTLSLRNFLRKELPDYMIPSIFTQLDILPLTPNGKTDYKTLSSYSKGKVIREVDFTPPVSPVEKKIAEIWHTVLEVECIGLRDNFFDLGGHSLLIIKVISMIEDSLKISVPIRDFFYHTMGQIASHCEEKISNI